MNIKINIKKIVIGVLMLTTAGCCPTIRKSAMTADEADIIKVRFYAYKRPNNMVRIYIETKNTSNQAIYTPFIFYNNHYIYAYSTENQKNIDLTDSFQNEIFNYFDYFAKDKVFNRIKKNEISRNKSDSILKIIARLYPSDVMDKIKGEIKKEGLEMRLFTEILKREGFDKILLLPPQGEYTVYETIREEFIPENGLKLYFKFPKPRNWPHVAPLLDTLMINNMKFPDELMGYKLYQRPVLSDTFVLHRGQIPEPDKCDPASPEYNLTVCDSMAWLGNSKKRAFSK